MKQPLLVIMGIFIIVAIAFLALRFNGADDQVFVATPTAVNSPPLGQPEFLQIAPDVVLDAPEKTTSLLSVANEVNVSIDDEGFDPATITIPVGTTVVFTNNGQALHWPASDPHPTHTNVSGFDAEKGLPTGETYSFTFTEQGTFGMHDHLNAKMKGLIVVQ